MSYDQAKRPNISTLISIINKISIIDLKTEKIMLFK